MFRRSFAVVAAVALMAVAPGATAAEPVKVSFDGAIELQATNGYHVFGVITSYEGESQIVLFIGKRGEGAVYSARGTGTENSIDVDLGRLGRFDAEVRPSGGSETLRSKCGGKGKATAVPASELVGTLEFHGEEGFTEASATRAPLRIAPLLKLVCGGFSSLTTSGSNVGGVELTAKTTGSPTLLVQQNHPGARVFYEARMREKEGTVRVSRTVTGHLGAGAIRYASSLESASFAAGSPFSGSAKYTGRTPPGETRPGTGAWLGSLKVNFPGHAHVPIAGRGFKATIVHAHRIESTQ